MSKRILVVLSLVALLVTSFAVVGTASASVRYVCYYAGYIGGFAQGTRVHTSLYDGNGTLLYERTNVAVTDNANFFWPVMMPIDGYEISTITFPNGFSVTNTYLVANIIIPDINCAGGVHDGRLNGGGDEMAAPVAVYCSPE